MRVPAEAGAGKARVTLAFPGLEALNVGKRVVEVQVEPPAPEDAGDDSASRSPKK